MLIQALIMLSFLLYGLQENGKTITDRLSRLDYEVERKFFVFEIAIAVVIVAIGKFAINSQWIINLSASIVSLNFFIHSIQTRRESASALIKYKQL